MKKLLIVGAGLGQIPIIQSAKKMGIQVFCIDRNKNAPGVIIADDFEEIDVIDKDAVFEYALKNKIDGIMTYQSDIGVPTVGYVNDKLGLSGVSFKTALTASNKIFSREQLAKHKISQPNFAIVSNLVETKKACESIGFPCVIKAPDSSGSRGVTKVNNNSQINKAYTEAKKISRFDSILVEEFIDGYEIGAQTFSQENNETIVFLHNDTFRVENCLVPTGHSLPIKKLSKEVEIEVEKEIISALSALGINNGPANVDLIIKKNKAYIIEIGARAGATCLPELIFHHSGINWEQASINSALGMIPDIKIKTEKAIAVSIIYSDLSGSFVDYSIDEYLFQQYQVLDFEIEIKTGQFVNKLSKGTDRIGKVICSGKSVIDAEKNIENFLENLKITLE